MKQRCIIVEDEPLARDVLREYISMHGELTLTASYENADKAMSALQSTPSDILFLDIGMPGTSVRWILLVQRMRPSQSGSDPNHLLS
jgi:DNA-binding NarL/FixJ family response regulator